MFLNLCNFIFIAPLQLWYKNLKTLVPARKLTAMYLANDVVQNSKKRGPEYAKEFGLVMRKVFDHLASTELEEKTIMSLARLIGIWQERQIFDNKTLHDIHKIWDHKRRTGGRLPPSDTVSPKRRRVSSGGSEAAAERRKSREIAEIEDMLDAPLQAATASGVEKAKPDVETLTLSPRQGGSPGSGDPPEPEELIQALQDLENSASSDALVREKIAKLPPEVQRWILANVPENQQEIAGNKSKIQLNNFFLILFYQS